MNDKMQSVVSANGWISIEDQLPDLNVNVLMYHELKTTDEGIYPYMEIGYLSNPMTVENCEDLEWRDKEHNSLSSPSHWMPLPNFPAPFFYRKMNNNERILG